MATTGPADWPLAYSQYLARSAAQTGQTLKLYNEVLEHVSRGRLSATVFHDYFPRFAHTRGAGYATKIGELGARFLNELLQGTATEAELTPPRFDSSDPMKWSEQLAEYAGKLNARALAAYRAQLDQVAANEIRPEVVQQTTADYLSRNLPGYLQRAARLYFELLNGLNDIRAACEEDYFRGLLASASPQEKDPPILLNLKAPIGETVSASISIANTTESRAMVRCTATDVRRTDGVGPAFQPEIELAPEGLELGPGEEGSLRLSLQLDETKYDAEALYAGTVYITGPGESPVEVQLRITATPNSQ
jgi:hypothetical protein